ncbi:MAG: hypothetical protein JST89_08465 [Cyanobacteria bacterium SZAS-4]|nr:hypothetical protein [Cyanobacteria bacterium SZAS-4]
MICNIPSFIRAALLVTFICFVEYFSPAALGANGGARTLKFPSDHSFGVIKIANFKSPNLIAKGAVEIPAGGLVDLIVDYGATHDLSPLRNLPPDSIYKLDLKNLEIENAQLKNIENLTGLKILDLEATDITDEGLRWLHKLDKLERLKLRTTLVTGRGITHLKPLTSLTFLSLASDPVGDDGLENLAALKNLTELELSRSRITDAGVKRIAPSSQLKSLDIEFNDITDNGIASLVGMKKLKTLLLSETKVSASCLKYLKQLPSLKQLVYSQKNFVGLDNAKLSAALPHCHVDEYLKHRNAQLELFEPLH